MRRLPPANLDSGDTLGDSQAPELVRDFRVVAVLSIYHNKLMCGFDETRELMDFMAGERVYLWDIPVVMKLCRPALEKKYPWIKNHNFDASAKADSFPRFVRKVIAEVGTETLSVTPLKAGKYKARSCSESLL